MFIDVMAPQIVGKKIYDTEILMRAFEYFATSRSLYTKLRDGYKLPSVTTLTLLTSKVTKLDDLKFLGEVFNNIEERQRRCIILVDEIYVKTTFSYHGGQLFGIAENNDSLAKTVVGIMIKCLYGGPTFLLKMIPVTHCSQSKRQISV